MEASSAKRQIETIVCVIANFIHLLQPLVPNFIDFISPALLPCIFPNGGDIQIINFMIKYNKDRLTYSNVSNLYCKTASNRIFLKVKMNNSPINIKDISLTAGITVILLIVLCLLFFQNPGKPSKQEDHNSNAMSAQIESGIQNGVSDKNDSSLSTKGISESGNPSSSVVASNSLTLAPPEKRYALLIGIDKYKEPKISTLLSCSKDMTDLRDILIKYTGFMPENITLMTDNSTGSLIPSANNIREQVENLKKSIPEDAMLIVAFSCHGTMIDMQDGTSPKSYLIAQDTKLSNINSYIDREWLFKTIDECPAEKKLLFCDACRSLAAKTRLDNLSSMTLNGKAIRVMGMDAPSKAAWKYNYIFMSSCSEGQVSIESGANGLFLGYLLEGIRTGEAALRNGDLTAFSWFDYASKKTILVSRERFGKVSNIGLSGQTEQTPRINIPSESSSFIITKLE